MIRCITTALVLFALNNEVRGDFYLWEDWHLDVTTSHEDGRLWDQSTATVFEGASIRSLSAWNSSSVSVLGGWISCAGTHDFSNLKMSGGNVGVGPNGFFVRDFSTVQITGGSVYRLRVWDSSTVKISGGSLTNVQTTFGSGTVEITGGTVERVNAYAAGSVNISGDAMIGRVDARSSAPVRIFGGSVAELYAFPDSTVIFHGKNFASSGDITMEGDRVLGLGTLSGQWHDGTPWAVDIQTNYQSAVIRATPEPPAFILLSVACLVLVAYATTRRGRTIRPRG